MFKLLIARFLIVLLLLFRVAHSEPLQPLTDTEADAIILAQETSKIAKKAARISELEQATVKSEGRATLPNGQKVIIREVEPPSDVGAQLVETAPELKPVEPQTLTPEQLTLLESFAGKDYQTLMLSATVYDRKVTRLSWRHQSDEYVAFTNADFNYLGGTHSLDVDNTNFTFFMGIGNASRNDNPYGDEVVPDISTFSSERSEYVIVQGDPDNASTLAGIEALLEHYDTNLPTLKIAHQRRKALTAAKNRYDAKHPAQPEEFIVQFWVPEPTDRKAAE